MMRHEWAIQIFRRIRHDAERDYLDTEARLMAPAREVRRITMKSASARLHQILSEPDMEMEDDPC